MRDCRRRGHRNRLRRGNRRSPPPPAPSIRPSVHPSLSPSRHSRHSTRLYPTIQILIQLRENDVVAPLSYVLASSSASLSPPPPTPESCRWSQVRGRCTRTEKSEFNYEPSRRRLGPPTPTSVLYLSLASDGESHAPALQPC